MLTPKERECFAAHVIDEVRRWPGVEMRPHASGNEPGEFDGVEFRFCGRQIGHVHGDCGVHLSLTKALKARVISEELAQDLAMASSAGWTMFNPMSASDVKQAIWLLRLNYVRLRRQRLTPDAAAANAGLQEHHAALALFSSGVAEELHRTRARSEPRPLPTLDA